MTILGKLLVSLGFALILLVAVAKPQETKEPPLVRFAVQPLPVEFAPQNEQERVLFQRVRAWAENRAEAKVAEALEDVANHLEATVPNGTVDGKAGWGAGFAVVLAGFVKKVIAATIGALIVAAIFGLFWAYWYYPVGFCAVWLATTALVSKLIARREVRKGKP